MVRYITIDMGVKVGLGLRLDMGIVWEFESESSKAKVRDGVSRDGVRAGVALEIERSAARHVSVRMHEIERSAARHVNRAECSKTRKR